MYESTTTEFKPIDAEMPDTIQRFKLNEVKATIKHVADGDGGRIVFSIRVFMLTMIGGMFIIYFSQLDLKKEKEKEMNQRTKFVNSEITSLDYLDPRQIDDDIDQA